MTNGFQNNTFPFINGTLFRSAGNAKQTHDEWHNTMIADGNDQRNGMTHARSKYKTKLIFHVNRKSSLSEPALQINFNGGEGWKCYYDHWFEYTPTKRLYRDLFLLRKERRLVMMLQDITAVIIHETMAMMSIARWRNFITSVYWWWNWDEAK